MSASLRCDLSTRAFLLLSYPPVSVCSHPCCLIQALVSFSNDVSTSQWNLTTHGAFCPHLALNFPTSNSSALCTVAAFLSGSPTADSIPYFASLQLMCHMFPQADAGCGPVKSIPHTNPRSVPLTCSSPLAFDDAAVIVATSQSAHSVVVHFGVCPSVWCSVSCLPALSSIVFSCAVTASCTSRSASLVATSARGSLYIVAPPCCVGTNSMLLPPSLCTSTAPLSLCTYVYPIVTSCSSDTNDSGDDFTSLAPCSFSDPKTMLPCLFVETVPDAVS